jgi:ribonuclease HI
MDIIKKAEKWLMANNYSTPLLKWNTENWWEIPADFWRK